jgi:Outer membrane receptor for ferrienterochelin and colicins
MKTKLTPKLLALTACLLKGLAPVYGQTDSTYDLENMSLKDLLNVKIVSVSRSSESLFEAPLSASVITKEDIQRAGCTSIMEALRLVPGMLVREQTNGNFDVQLRGSYTTPNAMLDGTSVTTLVMVDNRPIFNYLKGSTFWEAVPIDLNDVEKIEVVRGPAGALYGPNAVNGVINIITRQAVKKGLNAVANSSLGNYRTHIQNASIGYKGNKWALIASGNYQGRNRTQSNFYEYFTDKWVKDPDYLVSQLGDTLHDTESLFPDPAVSMEKYAGNIFAGYDPAENVSLHLSTGIQHNRVQRVSSENGYGPLTTSHSNSRYIDLRAQAGRLSAQVSYVDGVQSADHQPGNKYDFNTFDASLMYNCTIGHLSLKPGLSYRSAIYDDTKYSDTANKTGIFNTKGEIITQSAWLRSEYKMLHKKLSLVAAVATNTFNYPGDMYLSYQFAAGYNLCKKHMVRAVYSRTPRSASIYDTYVDQTVPGYFPIGNRKYFMLRLEGNRNLDLLKVDMLELGYRGQIARNWNIELELFRLWSKNYSAAILQQGRMEMRGTDTLLVIPLMPTTLPVIGKQVGATAAISYSQRKWEIKSYVTVQYSAMDHYAHFTNLPETPATYLSPHPQQNNIYSAMGSVSPRRNTPAVFGGFIVNYAATGKLHIGVNAYYMSSHKVRHSSSVTYNDGIRGIDHIDGKCLVNAHISYELVKKVQLSTSFKNILNDTSREYFKTDDIPFMFTGGIQVLL